MKSLKLATAMSLILFFAITFISVAVFAQPVPPSPAASVPVDGGLSLLIAAGAAFGAKKIYETRKKANS